MTGRGEGRNRRIWRKGGVGRDRENESANGGKERKRERKKIKIKIKTHTKDFSDSAPSTHFSPATSLPSEWGETPSADPSPSLSGCRAGQCPGAPGSPAQPHAAGEGGSSPPAASARGTELLREPLLSAPQGKGQRERWPGGSRARSQPSQAAVRENRMLKKQAASQLPPVSTRSASHFGQDLARRGEKNKN